MSYDSQIEKRLKSLEVHLKEENDVLFNVVESFRQLDQIGYQLGLLDREQSYANRVSWWPMISILGTFSAGKSTFINSFFGQKIQRTGTQAVDDKFTVMCYNGEPNANVLPGVALDSDPRFPFYQISQGISEIVARGGQRIDAYLQLKTCQSPSLKGKIFIDSPGFDADSQRTATLRITDHIIDLSDLVLVFFDARHPEPGAMHDTLQHLVTETINRSDSNKFLFILNQIDVTAREDNPEEVVAAWQRSLAQAGLTAGRFYRIYDADVAVPINDPKVKERYESKRDADMADIRARIDQIGIERAYRIVGTLENAAKAIEAKFIPQVQELIARWKSRVYLFDAILAALLGAAAWAGHHFGGLNYAELLPKTQDGQLIVAGVGVLILAMLHLKVSGFVVNSLIKKLKKEIVDDNHRESLSHALRKNTCTMRTLFMPLISKPRGWGNGMRNRLNAILSDSNKYVQALNDRFTNPSGAAQKTDAAK